MNPRIPLAVSILACAATVTAAVPATASAAPSGVRVARGQIIVHTDTRQAHTIPSPPGDPDTYAQTTLFQDFTGDFSGHGTAVFIATVHHDGRFPDGTITFTGREAEYGTVFGHSGAFYFNDSHGLITPDGKVSGVFTSDGGILGMSGIDAHGTFFPTANPSTTGNLSHTADYAVGVRFDR